MKKVEVSGKTKVDGVEKEYSGVAFQFESVAEYVSWAEGKGKLVEAGKGEEQAVRAINDYEMRRQRQNMRPSKSKATGAGKITKAVSAALKQGNVSEEDIAKALANIGVSLPS